MDLRLSPVEIRIIGSLIEKEKTTPEYYPLTVNSLVNACNQKSNRNPVVQFNEKLVEDTLNELRDKKLVSRVTGSDMRVPKYKQIFSEELNLSDKETAVICILMLRGAQTVGEIKGRTGRMYSYSNLQDVNETLENLMTEGKQLVTKLPKKSGMKEARYMHLLAGEPLTDFEEPEKEILVNDEVKKIDQLAEEINSIKSELEELKKEFKKFKQQFE